MIYDVAIIGGGPAGATLARLIGQTHRVLLVDARPEAANGGFARGKCCGGLLAPDAQVMLSRMSLGLPKQILTDPQLFVVRAIDVARRAERYYRRFYINIDRCAFDSWLMSLVPPEVEVRLGTRFRSATPEDDGVELILTSGGTQSRERAALLVGADGAHSRVRRCTAPDAPAPRAYFALQEWAEAPVANPHFSALFDPALTDYYAWTIPKDGNLLIGAALPQSRGAKEKLETVKDHLRAWGFNFGRTLRREGAVILRPARLGQLWTGAHRVALIGEAAGWISPSSSEGLSYAFRSATLLAEALRGGLDGCAARYRRQTLALRVNIFLKIIKARLLYSPALRRLVMRCGLRSIELCPAAEAGRPPK